MIALHRRRCLPLILVCLLSLRFAEAVSDAARRVQNKFTLVGVTDAARKAGLPANRGCPASVEHVLVGTYLNVNPENLDTQADAVRFADLRVNGGLCNSSVDAQTATLLESLPANANNTPVETAQMFFLRGIDNSARKCRNYVAALPAFYFFTDDMPLFRERLQRENFLPPGSLDPRISAANKSQIFMLSQQYSRRDGSIVDNVVCTYRAAPTPQPSPASIEGSADGTESDDGGSACFPASALVKLSDGRSRSVEHLKVGDSVWTGASGGSDVYFFSHRDPNAVAPFLVVTAQSLIREGVCFPTTQSIFYGQCSWGKRFTKTITISPGHYLFTRRGLVAASELRSGHDQLVLAGGVFADVVRVRRIRARGLYAPHPLDERLVIDGFLVSSFTATVPPWLAHSLLSPLRLLYRMLSVTVEGVLDCGPSIRPPRIRKLRYMLMKNPSSSSLRSRSSLRKRVLSALTTLLVS